MAAGNTSRVNLRHRSNLPTPDLITQEGRIIKDLTMASDLGEAGHELELQQPTNPLLNSFDHGDHISELPPTMMPLTTAAMLSQRRKKKHSSSLKRSASTPNVRGFPNGDAGMTLAEKRRNKLGYHRTSVACGTFSYMDMHQLSLNFIFRTLQTSQDKMFACSRRPTQQMCQLHTTEERLQFLPRRPATAARETTAYFPESRDNGIEFVGFFACLGRESSSVPVGSSRRFQRVLTAVSLSSVHLVERIYRRTRFSPNKRWVAIHSPNVLACTADCSP